MLDRLIAHAREFKELYGKVLISVDTDMRGNLMVMLREDAFNKLLPSGASAITEKFPSKDYPFDESFYIDDVKFYRLIRPEEATARGLWDVEVSA